MMRLPVHASEAAPGNAPRRRLIDVAEIPLLLAVPVLLGLCAWHQIDQSALVTAGAAIACLAGLLLGFDRSEPGLRQIMPIVVLAALACAGRVLFVPFPDMKPVSALCILAGVVFGRRSGFMVGALAALSSNFFFGQGPWTPWQMYAWGLVGYFAGVLFESGRLERRFAVLAYGFASGLLYGAILNSWYIVGYVHPITWESALLAYGGGFPFDVLHGTSTAFFLIVVYLPWKVKLERIRRKYGMLPV